METRAYLNSTEVSLLAGETKVYGIAGTVFYCLESSGPFKVEFINTVNQLGEPLAKTGSFDFGVGLGVDLRGAKFNQVIFKNPSATQTLTARVLVGDNADVIDRRLNVVPNRGVSILSANDYTDYFNAHDGTLANGAEVVLSAIPTVTGQKHRKSVIVSINSATVTDRLTIQDATGGAATRLAVVPGNYSVFEFENSGDLWIRNRSGVSIDCVITEAWYMTTQY